MPHVSKPYRPRSADGAPRGARRRVARLRLAACLLVLAAALPASAADWDGRGEQRLRAWLAANGPAASPETADAIARVYRLLDRHGVDSAAAFFAAELGAFASELGAQPVAEAYLLAGQLHVFELERYGAAERLLAEAAARTEYGRDPDRYFATAHALAASHFWQFESEDLLGVAREAHERAAERGAGDWERRFARWIGRALEIEGEWANAQPYYERALALALRGDDDEHRFDGYVDLAVNTLRGGDPAAALELFGPAYDYVEGRDDLRALAQLWEGVARGQAGELDEAERLLGTAMATFDALGQRNRRLHVRMELAKVRQRAGDHAGVVPLAEAALALSAGREKAFDRLFGYGLLAEAYAGLGDYERAYDYLGRRTALRARLDSTNNVREMRELAARYDVELRERVIAEQAAALEERRWYERALAAAGAVMVGLSAGLWVALRRGRRIRQGVGARAA